MSGPAQVTTSHAEIKRWAERRNGIPACVAGTGDGRDPGVLRIEFVDPDNNNDNLNAIPWPQFFEKFDQSQLAFLYQNETGDGKPSRFCKFVAR